MKAMLKVNRIFVHCSVSDFGDSQQIDSWHRARPDPFEMIGYHYVILNGIRQSKRPYEVEDDGLLENGRPTKYQGAHVYGRNSDSIGICLIGIHHFTDTQIIGALPKLLLTLIERHQISVNNIQGHWEFDKSRTCPNINMARIRDLLLMKMAAKILRG